MRKQYKVDVLLSYDKPDEDSEILTFSIYLDEEDTKNEMRKEEVAAKKAFEKAEFWVRPGEGHSLSIKNMEEVTYEKN